MVLIVLKVLFLLFLPPECSVTDRRAPPWPVYACQENVPPAELQSSGHKCPGSPDAASPSRVRTEAAEHAGQLALPPPGAGRLTRTPKFTDILHTDTSHADEANTGKGLSLPEGLKTAIP